MYEREILSVDESENFAYLRANKYSGEQINKLHAHLALPSNVHGYSLAIQYMYNWFESKFEKDYFKGGIYIDGKAVLDDYKSLNKKDIIKRINPRARMEARVEYDFDRDMLDTYMAPPDLYLRKSKFNESFFKDYDRDMFLGLQMKALKMTFNYKVRVNTRAQQIDIYNRILMFFRIGSTMHDNLSLDFHIPKQIILNIADRAGFEIKNNEVVDIISFLEYLNSHSDIPFLFKIRAINQKAEFFLRFKDLYTHINCTDKPSVDDGERDGKLDFNFHVEFTCTLTVPVPHFFVFYSASDLLQEIETKEHDAGCVAIYSINPFDIPHEDENGWGLGATTDYAVDKGDKSMDLSPIFTGENSLARCIEHDMTRGISPYHFINIVVYKDLDSSRLVKVRMDWKSKIAYFEEPIDYDDILHIAIYYDKKYLNELDIELGNYNSKRISK